MDQGLAAVVAAGVGLVGAVGGAVAGGWAAIRGARDAAERTAAATLEQARRQAESERAQWLRQERLQIYTDYMRQARKLVDALTDILETENSHADDLRETGQSASREYVNTMSAHEDMLLLQSEAMAQPLRELMATYGRLGRPIARVETGDTYDSEELTELIGELNRNIGELIGEARISLQGNHYFDALEHIV